MRYRTIVADPPWEYERFATNKGGRYADGTSEWTIRSLPYAGMTLQQIEALPVAGMAASDARLFLWTTNRYLRDAFDVLEAWGFEYRQTLVWHKTGNPNPWIAHIAPNHAEFLLVGARGKPPRTTHLPSNVLAIDTNPAKAKHSQKPEAWLDHIERVSPGPYVELFARRARFGWDYWGDESLGTATMGEGRGDGNRRAGRAAS
jgi:N6-adenosine-specific RNA methylase IME4